MSEQYEKLTVLELRKVAKEMGVKLGAGISKQGIIDKLTAAAPAPAPDSAPAAETPMPVRKAVLITDDGTDDDEDVPVLTARPALASRPVIPPRTAGMGGASSLSTISAKAPAFTMEGSRAWHNPRAYSNNNYQRPAQNTWNTRPAAAEQRPYAGRAMAPLRPSAPAQNRPASYSQRFGPEQSEANPQPQDYRAPYASFAQQDYQPVQRGEYSQPSGYQQNYYRKDTPEAPQPAMNDLLMTGECGDASGMLEIQPDGYGFLRAEPGSNRGDVYVSAAQIRRFSLRSGDRVTGKTRPQRENDRNIALLYITEINGQNPEDAMKRLSFENLTALYPKRRIHLSGKAIQDPCLRALDLLSPIGFGQRALISAPPKSGETGLILKLANAITAQHPKAQVLVLLLDERPEEVTEIKEKTQAEVIAHTADQPVEALVRIAEMTLERVERLVEQKTDVVLLLNDLAKLCRACNQTSPATARTLQNGLAAGCMNKPRRFFGAARNTKEAGTLTIIAAQQLGSGSPADDAAAEEMRGIANMEASLLRLPGEKRMDPALDPMSCMNRRAELLLTEEETRAAEKIRAAVKDQPPAQALDTLCALMEKTRDNEQLISALDTLL